MTLAIQENVPLAELTTFQIGGAARYLVEVREVEELRAALAWARERNVPYFVLAGGSNVLFADGGFNGLVIRILLSTVVYDGMVVVADAGATLLTVIRAAAGRGLGGWENMAGIPGTVGGAVRGNAGAFGTEVKDVLVSARALNVTTGEVRDFDNAACAFAYRDSFFKRNPEWIVLSAAFALTPGEEPAITAKVAATIAEREKRHLQNVRAAGSFFMNPVAPQDVQEKFAHDKGVEARGGRVPAGWLIQEAGMKGHSIGGAQSSPQHADYIINADGTATADQVMQLCSMIKTRVRDQFGVQLHEEVTMAGF